MNQTKLSKTDKISEDWEIVELGQYIVMLPGFAFSSQHFTNGDGIPLIRIRDINKDETEAYYSGKYDKEYLVKKGDVLIGMDGEFNIHMWKGSESLLNQRVLKISSKDNKKLDEKFLYYNIQKPLKFIENRVGQTTVKHLSTKNLEKTKIPLPPLPEQHAIARVLSTVDEAIQKTDEAIETTERLKRGVMKKLLKCDNMDSLDSIFDIKTGTTPSTKEKKYWEDAKINWFTPADLGKLNGQIIVEESERKVSEVALRETNLNLMPKETIILSTRAPVGYVAILKKESAFNQGCKGLIPKNIHETNTYFFAYYLLSKKYELGNKAGQSTFKELSKDMLEKFPVPKIEIARQNKVVSILSTIDKKIEIERKRKGKLESIKRGLMNNLLTGRKRVKL